MFIALGTVVTMGQHIKGMDGDSYAQELAKQPSITDLKIDNQINPSDGSSSDQEDTDQDTDEANKGTYVKLGWWGFIKKELLLTWEASKINGRPPARY